MLVRLVKRQRIFFVVGGYRQGGEGGTEMTRHACGMVWVEGHYGWVISWWGGQLCLCV